VTLDIGFRYLQANRATSVAQFFFNPAAQAHE
jgi:hypothetical protein